MPSPLLLRDGNFTPRERTPWGGTRVGRVYKPWLVADGVRAPVIGESWEISVEPDFPSQIEDGAALSQVIAGDLASWVGMAGVQRGGAALLLKLLDAAAPLSVQIHPRDDWPGLDAQQSGKPECWYVLDADPGAHLLLGLAPGVEEDRLRHALTHDGDVAALLGRVVVKPGDFFVIDAGLVHAVGAGITLVEPQRVLPGRRGVTLRYWDHGRRYDGQGKLDPNGAPRELHVEEALAVTNWRAPRGDEGLARIRLEAGKVNLNAKARLDRLRPAGRSEDSLALEVSRVSGCGVVALGDAHADALVGLFVAQGEVTVEDHALHIPAGRSAVLPAHLATRRLRLDHAHAILASVCA